MKKKEKRDRGYKIKASPLEYRGDCRICLIQLYFMLLINKNFKEIEVKATGEKRDE